jgi:hypothetical protein
MSITTGETGERQSRLAAESGKGSITMDYKHIQPLQGSGIIHSPSPPVAPVAIHIQPLRGFKNQPILIAASSL